MSRTLATEWTTYRERVVPANAGVVQVQECRRAFYAGAASLFGLVMTELSPGQDSTPADEAVVEAIHRELLAFNDDVSRGRA